MKRIKNVSKKMLALLISALILVSMIPMSMFMVFAASDYDVTITVVDKTNNPLPELNVKFKLTDPATESFCTAKKVSEGVYLLEQASQALAAAQSGSGSITIFYNVEATGRDMVYGEVVVTRDNRNIEVNVAELEEPFIEFTNPEYNMLSIAEVWYGKNAKNMFDVSAVTNEDNASAIKYEIVDSTVADAVIDENGVATVNGIGNVKVRAWVETNDVYDFNERFITIITKNDNIAPSDLEIEYSVDYKDEKVVSNQEITVTLTGTDNETGVYKYYYKLDNASDYVEVTGNTFTMNPMYRGTLSIIVEDCAENTSTFDNGGRLIVLDNENPKIDAVYTMEDGANIFTKADGVKYTNGNITVDFEIKDANLDISGQPEVKVNGVVVPVTWDQATGKGTFVLTESGVYNYSVKYEDIATNTTVIDSETTLAIDREPPVINAIHGNPTEWTNQSITLTVEATDAGCEGILYSMDNGVSWQESPDFTIDVNGKYYFITKDALDNTSDPTEVIVTKIDKVAPVVSDVISDQLDENGNVIWVNPDLTPDANDVTVEGKVTDDLSGVVKLFRKINDGEFEEISFDAAASSFADGSINVECKDVYTYYCVDAATNKSEEVSIEVKIDKTAPQLVEKISEKTNVDITINGSVTDEGTLIKDGSGTAKVYYRLKDIETEWTAATLNGTSFTFETNLAGRKSGFYYYEIYFKDNAGNESAIDGASIEIEYDGTKPVVTMEPLDPEKWTNKERVIRGKFTDDWSGVKSAKYVRYDGDTVVEDIALTFDADGNFEFTIPNDKNNIDTYKITCVDNFTNVSDVVEFVPYIDVVAPAKPTITYKTTAIQKFLQFVSFGVYQAEPTVVIESSDDLSGVKEIEYTLGDKTETIKAVDGKIEITVPYGTKAKLTAVAYDNAGNNSEQKDTGKDPVDYEFGTVIVDNEAPVVDKAEADITDWTNTDVVISGTVSDTLSGVKEVYIKKGTATEFTLFATATTDADVTEFTYTIPAQDYEGNYIIYCKDYAGNESEKVAVAVKMDITKPVVEDTIKAQPDVWTNNNVIVSGTVSDNLSGVKTVYYKLSDGVVKTAALNDGVYNIVIEASEVKNYKGDVIVWCDDNAANVSDEKAVAIAIDTEKPVVDDGIATPNYWTNKDVVVSGKVHDVDVSGIYSDIANVQIKKDVEGADWSDVDFFDKVSKDYSHTVTTISGAGTYLIRTIDYAGNVSESIEVEVYIDVIPPVVESGKAVSADWTNENVEISGLVSDEASGVANVYIKKNVEGAEWEKVDNFDAATGAYTHIVDAQNYEGKYLIYCEDVAGNKSTDNAEAFSIAVQMDVDAPTDVKVEYDADTKWEQIKEDWFGFKKETITATLTANDNLSGIAGFAYSIDGGETFIPVDANGKFTIDPQYRGKLIFKAFDHANNEVTVDNDGRILVIDSIAPTVDVEYIFDEGKKFVESEKDNICYTNDEAVDIKFVITEANFDLADAPIITINGIAQEGVNWIQDSVKEDNWIGQVTLEGDGDYSINIKFADRSGNTEIDYTVDTQLRIDNTAPVISVDYEAVDGKELKNGRKATITVTEHNFVPEKVKAIIEATDIEGNKVSINDYNAYFADINNWTVDGDVYTTTITFDTDANYKFALTCSDIIDNTTRYPSEDVEKFDTFTVDKTGPQNLSIKYTEPALWEKVLQGITFGFYKAEVEVTLTAEDITSGVDSFNWKYTREAGASASNVESENGVIKATDITYSNDGKTATASFKLAADKIKQYRGSISFTATDKAGNESAALNDENRINVVDNVNPEFSVNYGTAETVTDNGYYYKKCDVKINIKEANFFSEEVNVTVSKDLVDYPVSVKWTDEKEDNHIGKFTLSEDGDYEIKISYADYSKNIMVNDNKEEIVEYTSPKIVIDQTAPIVDVEYSSETKDEELPAIFKTADGKDREYFKNGRVALITINEHNFRASDVKATVITADAQNNEIANAYSAYLSDAKNWGYLDAEGNITYDAESAVDKDVHVAQIVFDKQANYTFDIEYADLAKNKAANYDEDYFTVDSTVPADLKVEYSKPQLWKKILEDITFGFYNATMDVTISATDDIAGIYQFMFSYINNDGVSKVNAELKDQIVVPEYKNNRYEASFTIPLGVALDENNQFNGTIKFAAYDRSGNISEKTDSNTVVVVDSIAPTSTVTFNAPVKVIEDVSYYNSNIEAKVAITEANFYSEDVEIIVTKNGTPTPITVKWTDNSVDEHVGTFTLSEDGDYIVKVSYMDRSTNQMVPFESKQLTIDKTTPVITVGDVIHGSANNDEVIGLTVTVTDTNIAAENIKPVLNAVVQKDAGNNVYTYETVAISLGEPTVATNDKGETVYTYTVSNFKLDGYYTLVCNAVDNAGHSVSTINAPSGKGGTTSVKAMNYSVNRNGSVFWIKTEHNDKYTGETFTDKLNGAYANDKVVVKLYERNVDMVDVNEEKKTVFTLNDGSDTTDVLLVENDNYTKNVIVGTGAWYETVYTLDDDNFDNDGVYSLNIITYDRAENSNLNTKTESGTINFTLDRTNPVISANVKTGQTINAANFDVQFEIADANLDADTIEVVLIDRKGNEKVIDKAKIEAIGKNEFKFNVGSGLNYSIKVKAKDLAGNTSEIYSVEELTISTNIFVRWYANTPLFWGSIAAVVLLTAVIVIIIILKKKNDKDK